MSLTIQETLKDIGIFQREPINKWERFLYLFFREYGWARRILGGRWEILIWDKAELHYVIMYFWVTKWNKNENGYRDGVIGKEFYRNGIKEKFDFGDDWYAKQPHPLGDKKKGTFDPNLMPKEK